MVMLQKYSLVTAGLVITLAVDAGFPLYAQEQRHRQEVI